jgi:hypothetical protein
MFQVMSEANRERFARATSLVEQAYRHVDMERPPIVIQDANYSLAGEDPDGMPDDYFAEGAFGAMLERQAQRIEAHLARFDDAYVPFLFPWYGTGVVPSAFGCDIIFPAKEEPAVAGPIVTRPEEVRRLTPPDPERDGLMPRVLRCIDHMRANSDLPVSFTDCQGPLNIALNLVGLERLSLWMYEEPTTVHELMDLCTTVLIDWVRIQKRHAGQPDDGGAFPHFVVLPPGRGGVWISDDDSTVMSPHLYREFVVPYNSRVFQAFGGGTLHYCSTATHQLENFLATDGLVGVNNWCMGEFEAVFAAQRAFAGRVVFTVDDFAPVDVEGYFAELIPGLARRGTIVTIFPSATTATVKGRTVALKREPYALGEACQRAIQLELGRVRA